jgi:hypothetical protein
MSNVPRIKTGWWAFELPRYRPHPKPGTYSLFSYEELPPIQATLDDDFNWLKFEPVKQHPMAESGYSDGSKPDLGKLAAIVSHLNIKPLEPFLTFMRSTDLHHRLRSCTDCYFDVADRAVRTRTGFLIHFLSDSQWCVHWYVHVGRSGEQFVAASLNAYGFTFDDQDVDTDTPHRQNEIDIEGEEIWFCSPTFKEFIYRFWLENEIWFALAWDKRPLNATEQAYVNWYFNSNI